MLAIKIVRIAGWAADGHAGSAGFSCQENTLFARRANHIVAITSEMLCPSRRALGAPAKKISVIENWRPWMKSLQCRAKCLDKLNRASRAEGHSLLSGTLGLKHNRSCFEHCPRTPIANATTRIVVANRDSAQSFLKRRVKSVSSAILHFARHAL